MAASINKRRKKNNGSPNVAVGAVDLSAGIMGTMLRLAMPVFAEQLLHMLVGFSDTWLVGHYLPEPKYLAAVNSTCYLMWMLTELFVVVAIGSTALTARFVGAKNWEDAQRVMNQSLLVGGVLAVGFTLLAMPARHAFVGMLSLEGESATLAVNYLGWVIPTLPFIMLEAVGVACLRGVGDTRSGMLAMILVNVVNISVSWGLVLGWGPLPAYGWDGVALGTAAGHVVGGLLIFTFLMRGRSGLSLQRSQLRPQADLIRRILRVGIPGGLDVMAVLLCQLWFLKIVNQLGELPAAAHGVAIRVESLAFLPGSAFQVAAATLAGQYLGARDYQRASRSVWLTCLTGGGFMVAVGVLFLFAGEQLAGMMVSSQSGVAAMAAPLLRIIGIGMPPFAVAMILSGALRGAGDTRWPLVFTLIGYLGVRIPLAYLLTQTFNWGVEGAWYAMVTDLTIRCILISYRFWHGGWQRIEV